MIYRSCENCKHWEVTGVQKKLGECHFNPPTPLLNMDGDIIYIFPETLYHHKCGQFLQKKSFEKVQIETVKS